MNSGKEIDIKNCTYSFLDDIINIKNLDPSKVKIDEKLYKSILIYHIGYLMVKDLSCATVDNVSSLYLFYQ